MVKNLWFVFFITTFLLVLFIGCDQVNTMTTTSLATTSTSALITTTSSSISTTSISTTTSTVETTTSSNNGTTTSSLVVATTSSSSTSTTTTTTTIDKAILNININYLGEGIIDNNHKIYVSYSTYDYGPNLFEDLKVNAKSTINKIDIITFEFYEQKSIVMFYLFYDFNGNGIDSFGLDNSDDKFQDYADNKLIIINLGEIKEINVSWGASYVLNLFDKTSYFPIIKNAYWELSNGGKTTIVDIDNISGTITYNKEDNNKITAFTSNNFSGNFIGSAWSSNSFLPRLSGLSSAIFIIEESKLVQNFTWNSGTFYSGYQIEILNTVDSLSENVTTPNNNIYNNCLKLKQTFTYPNGFSSDPYITEILLYFKQGVGCVQNITKYSDNSENIIYLTNYNVP